MLIKGALDLAKKRQESLADHARVEQTDAIALRGEWRGEVDRLQNRADRQDARIGELERQVWDLQRQLIEANSTITQLKLEKAALEVKLRDNEAVSLDRQAMLNQYEARMTGLKSELLQAQNHVAELTSRLDVILHLHPQPHPAAPMTPDVAAATSAQASAAAEAAAALAQQQANAAAALAQQQAITAASLAHAAVGIGAGISEAAGSTIAAVKETTEAVRETTAAVEGLAAAKETGEERS